MSHRVHIGIIGDYDAQFDVHVVTEQAIVHAANHLQVEAEIEWIATPTLAQPVDGLLHGYDALWCAPGSPYRHMHGALNGIRYARESAIPFLGTCAGFQHVVIEFARNVLGFEDAQHAEYDPNASRLFIHQLACSLSGKTLTIQLDPASRVAQFYGRHEALEQYYCQFGLNPLYQSTLEAGGLHIAGVDSDNEARILDLGTHPFFIATLFLPQLNSSPAQPHPLVVAYLQSAIQMQASRQPVAIQS